MSHPTHRGDRRRVRRDRIEQHVRAIPHLYCYACHPASCHCEAQARRRGKAAKTPTPCSCFMCGNPRHHFKEVTMQEKRAALRQRDGEAQWPDPQERGAA